MRDVLLYRKWLKESVKTKLMFQKFNDNYFLTDGYIVFKFNKNNKEYVDITKQTLFQSLEKDFSIIKYKLIENKSPKLDEFFELKPKAKDTTFIYDGDRLMRIFKNNENKNVFVDIKFLKYFNYKEYEVFCDKPADLVLFKNEFLDVEILICPVRVTNFEFEIILGGNE